MEVTKQGEASVHIDTNTFRLSQSGQITGTIALKIGDSYFPELYWNDFVEIIIGWWINDLEQMLLNSENERDLSFMDGDFCLVISEVEKGRWLLQCAEEVPPSKFTNEIIVSLSQFARSIASAAKQVDNFCDQQKWKINESAVRKKMISEFETVLTDKGY